MGAGRTLPTWMHNCMAKSTPEISAALLHITQQNHDVQHQKSWGIALYNSNNHKLLSVAVSILILRQGETMPPLFTICDEIFTENSVLSHLIKADLLPCADQHQIVKSWIQPPTQGSCHWGKKLSKAIDDPSPSN